MSKHKAHRKKRKSFLMRMLQTLAIALTIVLVAIIVAVAVLWYRGMLPSYEELPRYKDRIANIFTRYKAVELPQGNVIGIDISHYQSDVDWDDLTFHIDDARVLYASSNSKTHTRPVDFVIAKATQGTTITDAYYDRNQTAAHQRNIPFGAYHFFSSQSSPEKQAQHFIKVANLQKGDIVPILDVEIYKNSKTPKRADVLKWLQTVENYYGVTPIIYTGENFYKSFFKNDAQFRKYNFWIARYGGNEPSSLHLIWQTTDNGKVGGISGPTDIDVFHGSLYDLTHKYVIR